MNQIYVTPKTWFTERQKIKSGDEVVFSAGDWVALQIELPSGSSGTPQQPTILRAETAWRTVLRHSPYYGIYTGYLNNIIIDGFDIEQPRGTGIKLAGSNITVRQCMINGAGLSGIEAQNCTNMLFDSNVIQFCGHNPKHHGLYLTGGNHQVRRCVLRNNAGRGIAAIPIRHHYEDNLIALNHEGVWLNCGASVTVIKSNTIADNQWSQLMATGTSYKYDVQISLQHNAFAGTAQAIRFTMPKPHIVEQDSLYQPQFMNAEAGDYRQQLLGNRGWQSQWTSTEGWDGGRIPYRFNPNDVQPLSLLPAGVRP